MVQGGRENWLVWAVLALMVAAGLAALALSPAAPSGPASNRPPIPVVSPTGLSVDLGTAASFSGANSTDPDGTIVHFAWQFGDGDTADGAVVSHNYTATGAYTVALEVTDDKGARNRTTTMVWVNLEVDVPFASATWNQVAGSFPFETDFPVDANATRVTVLLDVNTTTFVGAKALVTLLDPNGAEVHVENLTVRWGEIPAPISFFVDADNLTVEGQWQLRVEAQPANAGQPSATIGFSGRVRVEYTPQ